MHRPHYRRNFFALIGDYVGFGLGMTFVGLTTVLPDFVARLTDNKMVVGLFLTAADGAWLLPQLFFAHFLTDKPRKKPYVTLGALVGRPAVLLYALALWLGLDRSPTLALGLLMVVVMLFLGSDALSAVAWFDILAKAIPEERRGRLVGISQVIQGLLAIGAGAVIAALLGQGGPGFPLSYVAIFSLAGVFLLFSLACWLFAVEPEVPVAERRPSGREYLAQMRAIFLQDKVFARLMIVRLLSGVELMAISFYILFALEELGLPPETVGVYTAVQTVGNILASVGLAVVSERAGSHRVVQIATALAVVEPVVGLLLVLTGASVGPLVAVLFGGVFLAIGAVGSAFMLGPLNYVLELAPAEQRPTYIGLFNTIGGVVVVLPLLGGWLLQATSYGLLFALTAAALFVAHLLSWGLPSLRKAASSAAAPSAALGTGSEDSR